jgi:hypothetical protein
MLGFGTIDERMDLVRRMADALGLDLGEEVAGRRLSGPDLRSAVVACAACEQTPACRHWLDGHGTGATAAPGYCRNADLFARLVDQAR